MTAALPKLLYVGDVPVESSQHGSALIFRALESYPSTRLEIIETGRPSEAARRLGGVTYRHVPIGRRHWLDSRLHAVYSAWLTLRARSRAGALLGALEGFAPDAILTVGHGFGWLAAAGVAARINRPLHLVIHDDWPRLSAITSAGRPWLERAFARVYRSASSRLCISPFMAEEYERRYGGSGSVMYPSRSAQCQVFAAKPARVIGSDTMVIGYGGNSSVDIMSCLLTLAACLDSVGAQLAIFGPFEAAQRQALLAVSKRVTFHGFLPFNAMIAGLREVSDLLFVPMTFNPHQRDNMIVSFPSKLADYTAAGVPMLVYGPSYSSAVRWASAHAGAAEIVTESDVESVRRALSGLRDDVPRRRRLADGAVNAGSACFSADAARAVLTAALTEHGR
jgi:glycosyltransferase involved in cell wall biosynthesis